MILDRMNARMKCICKNKLQCLNMEEHSNKKWVKLVQIRHVSLEHWWQSIEHVRNILLVKSDCFLVLNMLHHLRRGSKRLVIKSSKSHVSVKNIPQSRNTFSNSGKLSDIRVAHMFWFRTNYLLLSFQSRIICIFASNIL